MEYTMAFKLDRDRVRLVLIQGEQELLRASLPPPARFWSGNKAVKALLESLALWLDTRLRVVFAAADPADGWSLELTDELGIGCRTLFYEVFPVEPRRLRRRRLGGVGDFRDVHQLCLLDLLTGGNSRPEAREVPRR
jgi:hypothetical protein